MPLSLQPALGGAIWQHARSSVGRQRPPRAARRVLGRAMPSPTAEITFRNCCSSDLPEIRQQIWKEKMNPLGLDRERFCVATDDASGAVVGFGQLKPAGGGAAVELSSVVVLPEHRGSGAGSKIIAELVRRAAGHDVYLTTTGRRKALYERQGFQEVPPAEWPGWLRFEALAGTLVARLAVGDRLLVMRRQGGS